MIMEDAPVDLAKIHRFYGGGERCRACGELDSHAWHAHPECVLKWGPECVLKWGSIAESTRNSLSAFANRIFTVAPEAAVWEDRKLHAVFVECLPEHWQAVKGAAWFNLPVAVLLVIAWFGAAQFTEEDVEFYLEDVPDNDPLG